MDIADDSFLLKVIDGLFGLCGLIMGVLVKIAHGRIEKQESAVDNLEKDHNRFKLFAANEYAKTHTVEAMGVRLEGQLAALGERLEDKVDALNHNLMALLQKR